MTAYRFLEPLDVLFLRGNKLFGDPGSYGESLVPPWPSVAAGAIRSQMMVEGSVDFEAFKRGAAQHPALGTLDEPGPFAISGFWLARRNGKSEVETLHPLPSDLVVTRDGTSHRIRRLYPVAQAAGLVTSAPLQKVAALAAEKEAKPVGGLWVEQDGWEKYLAGETPAASNLVESARLWSLDHRVGVGLDIEQRRAKDGQLFSAQAVAMVKRGHKTGDYKENDEVKPVLADYDTGFLVAIDGAEAPTSGMLRFGGDGRAAAVHFSEYHPPAPDLDAITGAFRCRIVLTTPGIFPGGWRPYGVDAENCFALGGVTGRLVCAAVSRCETVSGWDLARRKPKPAQRVAPAGSVYWLEDVRATPDALRKLVAHGLWPEQDYDTQRRAEGFNRFTFATY